MNSSVSFCITCMGRLKHLQETLPVNLLNNQQTSSVDFVLLDYSSPDGLGDWIKSEMMAHLESGRLVYYFISDCKYFHMAHAKNVAHRLAQGEIVCNLDADNFTGPSFAEYLIQIFYNRDRLMVRSPGGKGAQGRIAMRKSNFEAINGYDERMEFGWGFEDKDLIRRARMAGIEEHMIPSNLPFHKTIPHENWMRAKHNKYQNLRQSNKCHILLSEENIRRGEFIANRGKKWGSAIVKKNFSETIIL